VRRATTAHVPKLIDLIYRTYRYSYAHSEWYDENNFRKVIEDKRIIALIAETNAGAVIGSLIIHFDSPQLAELGSLMTDPNYRASKAVALLAKEYVHLLRDDTFKNTIFYVELVTTHAQSQRLVNLFKFAAVGLRLSVYDRARFIGINEATRQRESHVFSVLTTRLAGKSITGYAPPQHQKIIDKLLTNTGICLSWAAEASLAIGYSHESLSSRTYWVVLMLFQSSLPKPRKACEKSIGFSIKIICLVFSS
jgi:N-acetylglutamate synthase-like GNAT family acetyltransferase